MGKTPITAISRRDFELLVPHNDKTAIDTSITAEFDRNADEVYKTGASALTKSEKEIREALIVERL